MAKTVQELIDLTPKQAEAWKQLEKAVKCFEKAGGKFYTVLDTVYGYNGKHVDDVGETGKHFTGDFSMPSITSSGLSGFADDWHGFTFKDGVEVDHA